MFAARPGRPMSVSSPAASMTKGQRRRSYRQFRRLAGRLDFKSELIVGSIRSAGDVISAALAGAHIITVPRNIWTKSPTTNTPGSPSRNLSPMPKAPSK